jgi:hypothetical protein
MNKKMKQIMKSRLHPVLWTAIAVILLNVVACDDKEDIIKTFTLSVQLEYPDDYAPREEVAVRLKRTNADDVMEAKTNAEGIAKFTVLAGIHEASASDIRYEDGHEIIFGGNKTNIVITDAWEENGEAVSISMTGTESSQLVIKELYIGGAPSPVLDENGNPKLDDKGEPVTTVFARDPYMILYNNLDAEFSADNLAFGSLFPLNSNARNEFMENGELIYLKEDWIPAAYGIWYIDGNIRIAAGEQIVIAMNSGNDHTKTYKNSINFANPDYYVGYHPESGFNNTLYHPSPSEVIPTSHYLKAYRFSGVTSNAWSFSITSPSFILFLPQQPLGSFTSDPANLIIHGTLTTQAGLKVPREWILEGIEVFNAGDAGNQKRLTPDIDAGYVEFTSKLGYTLYRNVNKEATEAFAGNEGKIVYNYILGTSNSTDPSGIDAEASIKSGARIIYKDTNNSTADFHQRQKASLRE